MIVSDTVRKQFRDIRIGEMLVLHDTRCPWAIVEDVQPFPATYSASKGYRRVLLANADGRNEWTTMRLVSYWDVAR